MQRTGEVGVRAALAGPAPHPPKAGERIFEHTGKFEGLLGVVACGFA